MTVPPRPRPALLALAALVSACGLGAGAGGGADNLPTLGAGPYRKLEDPTAATPANEPILVEAYDLDYADPSALADPDHPGGFRLYFTRAPRLGGAPEIWTARLPSLGDLPVDEALVLAAARAPSALPDGTLYHQPDGADAIWRRDPQTGAAEVVLADAADPGALLLPDGRTLLAFTRPSAPGIFLAESADGRAFTALPEPILAPRPGVEDAFDALSVREPSLVGGLTAGGQLRVGVFYTGEDDGGRFAVGYAGSDDLRVFQRFRQGSAVMEPKLADERGPSAVIEPARGVLFFAQKAVLARGIAGAITP